MGKRSDFQRRKNDDYPTPLKAVLPLLPFLPPAPMNYCEPCVGDGQLVDHLAKFGYKCTSAFGIEPDARFPRKIDATKMTRRNIGGKADMVITNPPWTREILHEIIMRCVDAGIDSWLLFDADWMHTQQATPYMKFCKKIVSVGRVRWIPDSKMDGKDNCCWYNFLPFEVSSTTFYARKDKIHA
jgi:hypothetical protein